MTANPITSMAIDAGGYTGGQSFSLREYQPKFSFTLEFVLIHYLLSPRRHSLARHSGNTEHFSYVLPYHVLHKYPLPRRHHDCFKIYSQSGDAWS